MSVVPRYTFVGRKGGVGKTSCAVGVADDLAYRYGQQVLLLDMDPQANATAWCGVTEPKRTMNDVLYNATIEGALNAAVTDTEFDRVWLVPAEEELASREADRVASSELRLRRLLRTADLEWVDTVVIDSPPSLGPLMVSALNAADRAVLVTDSERGGVDGLARVLSAATTVAEDSNPNLAVAGIIMNQFDGRFAEHAERWQELQRLYQGWSRWKLPSRAAVANAFGASVPTRVMPGGSSWVHALRDVVEHLVAEQEGDT